MNDDGMPRRPARTSEREVPSHKRQVRSEAPPTVTVLAIIPRGLRAELRIAMLELEGSPPILSIGHYRDGERRGWNIFKGEDLAKLAKAVAHVVSARKVST